MSIPWQRRPAGYGTTVGHTTISWVLILLLAIAFVRQSVCAAVPSGDENSKADSINMELPEALKQEKCEELFSIARRKYDAGSYGEALDACSAILELQEIPAIRGIRAMCYYNLGKLAIAEEDLTQAIARQKNFVDALFIRGLVRLEQGRPAAAIEDFTSALKLSPSWLEAYAARAKAYVLLEDYENAVADFTTIIDFDDSATKWRLVRAECFLHCKRYIEAVEDIEKVLAENGDSSRAHAVHAAGKLALGSFEDAISGAKRALALDVTNAKAYAVLADALARGGDLTTEERWRARAAAIAACEYSSWADPLYLSVLANICFLEGDRESALRYQEAAVDAAKEKEKRSYLMTLERYQQPPEGSAVGERIGLDNLK